MTAYDVKIVYRDGDAMVGGDWHATATRRSDGARLVWTSTYLWLLRWRMRRASLDREFKRYDRHVRKAKRVQEFSV